MTRTFTTTSVEDARFHRKLSDCRSPESIDPRPFALCTEDGEQLPCLQSVSLSSELTTVFVVFLVDGCRVLVEGDA